MKRVPGILVLLVCSCAILSAADLGSTWAPVVPEGHDMWLRTAGTVDGAAKALVAGPNIWVDSITLDGAEVIRPVAGGVPEYRGYVLPLMTGGTSHVVTVRFHDATPSSLPPVLSISGQEGLPARLAVLNLPVVPLRLFSGLLSLLVAIQLLSLFWRQRARESLFLLAALGLNAVAELAPSFFSAFLPAAAAARLSDVGYVGASLFIAYSILVMLKSDSPAALLALLAPPFAAGCVVLAVSVSSLGQVEMAMRGISALSFAVIAVLAGISRARAGLKRAMHPLLLAASLFVGLAGALVFDILLPGRGLLAFLPGMLIALFQSWQLAGELVRTHVMYRQTSQELIERIETDWEMIERIREGKELLEKRNIDIMKLSTKLLESAQKQSFTIGRPHRFPGRGGHGRIPRGGQGEGHPRLHRAGGWPDHEFQRPDPRDPWRRWRRCTSGPSSSARR